MMTKEFTHFVHHRHHRDLDKEAAKRILFDFSDLLIAHGVPHFLAYGTLLGAVRDGDFIQYDTDIDVGSFVEYADTVRNICRSPSFDELGLKWGRDCHGVISIWRDSEYLDLYLFEETPNDYSGPTHRIEKFQLQNGFSQIEFLGRSFNTVLDPEADLRWRYGDDWQIVKRGHNAQW
jgi:lipopolysaccharide cholinephosphotransferase